MNLIFNYKLILITGTIIQPIFSLWNKSRLIKKKHIKKKKLFEYSSENNIQFLTI